MGDAPAERAGFGVFLVDVDRIEIAGQPGEQDDVGLGDGFREGRGLADAEVAFDHERSPPVKNSTSSWAWPSSITRPLKVRQPSARAWSSSGVVSGLMMTSITRMSEVRPSTGAGRPSPGAMPIGVALMTMSWPGTRTGPALTLQAGNAA